MFPELHGKQDSVRGVPRAISASCELRTEVPVCVKRARIYQLCVSNWSCGWLPPLYHSVTDGYTMTWPIFRGFPLL